RRGLVHVPDVGDVFVDDNIVVVIVDDDVVHGRVGDVDVCDVSAADAIRRHIDFARRKRKPGDADSTAASDSNANAEVRSADPGDESRSVNRTHVGYAHNGAGRARYPAPNAANGNPTAVMEGSKAPRLIVDPRPAPRRNPNPVAVAIGSPAHDGRMRKPSGAIFG